MRQQILRGLALALVCAVPLVACGPEIRSDGDDGGSGPGDGGLPQCGEQCANYCPAGTSTMLSGVVTAPNGIDPVPGAVVYVPLTIEEFPVQVTCEICGDILSNAIIATTTAPDGSFTLGPLPTSMNPPPGGTITVISQKGRFRRVAEVSIGTWCAANTGQDADFRLPSKNEGRNTIPNIAVATGDYDKMECVLLKLGIENGAFDLYGGVGQATESGLVGFNTLLENPTMLKSYNIVFINCAANTFEDLLTANAQVRTNVEDYVNSGGRLYVTDWSYDYIEQVPGWSARIDFGPGASSGSPEEPNAGAIGEGEISTEALVQDPVMISWLNAVEARTGDSIIDAMNRVHIQHFLVQWVMQLMVAPMDTSKVWLTGQVSGDGLSGDLPLTTTFDVNSCGRVLYSSYHTLGRDDINPFFPPETFPIYCASGALSPQERVLEYLILHVADCIVVE